jgi:hypothetical protein
MDIGDPWPSTTKLRRQEDVCGARRTKLEEYYWGMEEYMDTCDWPSTTTLRGREDVYGARRTKQSAVG